MSDTDIIRLLARLERPFAARGYEGRGCGAVRFQGGSVPVMVSAPHAVNQVREGRAKPAELLTGAIARLLGRLTGCHVVYAASSCGGDPNYDEPTSNPYQGALIRYVQRHGIRVLVDLHGSSADRPFAVELGTAPGPDGRGDPSLHDHPFIARLLRFSLEHEFEGLEGVTTDVWRNRLFDAGSQNTVTRNVAAATRTDCIQLEVNARYRSLDEPEALLALVRGLEAAIRTLSALDWGSSCMEAYRIRPTSCQVPQDVVRMSSASLPACLADHELVCVQGATGRGAKAFVRLEPPADESADSPDDPPEAEEGQFAALTNRLIQEVCGRQVDASLYGAAVVVSLPVRETFAVGVPRADRLDCVTLSSALHDRLVDESHASGGLSYALYNRISDTSLPIEVDSSDYGDDGRVQGEKVMVPRYYRKLLGLLDLPLGAIRAEEFPHLVDALSAEHRDLMRRCYERSSDGAFMFLKTKSVKDEDLRELSDVQRDLGLVGRIELVRWPRSNREHHRPVASRWRVRILERVVGSSSYSLRATWTSLPDDAHRVARLSPYMMSLLGVDDHGKVVVTFAGRSDSLRVLGDPGLDDCSIGIPAPARMSLGLDSVNDIVSVSRDMGYILSLHSEEQVIVILGTILTLAQIFTDPPVGLLVSLVCVPLIIYFALFSERAKVK